MSYCSINEAILTEKQRIKFEAIRTASYEVSRAWQVRESFKGLFASQPQETFALFCRWAHDAVRWNIKEMPMVVEMFKSHLPGIIESRAHRLPNVMAERLNGKIQEIKLAGRVYRAFKKADSTHKCNSIFGHFIKHLVRCFKI